MEHDAQRPDEPSSAQPEDAAEPEDAAQPAASSPPAYTGPPLAAPSDAKLSETEARTFGMLAHLSALAGFIVPFGHIIGPLLVWLIKREEHPFVDDQGKEALNFQLSMSLYYLVGLVLIFVLIGFLVLPALAVFSLIMTIIAGVKANTGERYRYPLCIRFIK